MTLRAEGIEKKFFRKTGESNYFCAVQKTDFELPAGQLTEITGRSGSGKSTFLNMLAGLLSPSAGSVLLDGQSLYGMPDPALSRLRNRALGVIPQGQSALHSLTVLENVLLPARMYAGKADEARAMSLLSRVGIAPLAGAKPAELSGGELRRMAIARAMMNRPGVLLCDEPTGDLDDENTAAVLKLLRQTAEEEGTAVLLVTHEAEAARYAHSIWRMDAGVLTRQ